MTKGEYEHKSCEAPDVCKIELGEFKVGIVHGH